MLGFSQAFDSTRLHGLTLTERRLARRRYETLLPEFFPVKLVADAIAVDFVVGHPVHQGPGPARRHPARQAILDAGVALDARVSPRKVLAWLRSMPSFLAGVPLRLGHDADPGLAFDKSAELMELVDPRQAVAYLLRRPLSGAERAFLARRRANVLLELTAAPRSARLGLHADPLEVVRSAEGLGPERIHWVVGPLAAESFPDAERLVEALPAGSRLTLAPLDPDALPRGERLAPLPAARLLALEHRALQRRLAVTEWRCRGGLAEVGRGFPDVDRLTGQADLGRRALDLVTCAACPSMTQCHGTLDLPAAVRRLERELRTLGLSAAAPPLRTGPRSLAVQVLEPTAAGDEAYLGHALGQPVRVRLSCADPGPSPGAGGAEVEPAVLRRWWARGFLPVNELNAAAENVLDDLRRNLGERLPGALRPELAGVN